jgi:hypothetical protein
MGAVYEAERVDGLVRQRVAIKTVWRGADSDVLTRRFRSERQILAGLVHANIAQFLDAGATEEGTPYLVMEYLRGGDLNRRLKRGLHMQAAISVVKDIARGLDTAHSSFAHNNHMRNLAGPRQRDRRPKIDVERTGYGYYYVSTRDMGAEENYVRVYQYMMPAQQMRASSVGWFGGKNELPRVDGHIWAPIDDVTTHVYNWICAYDETVLLTPEWIEKRESSMGRGTGDLIPGTFRLKRNQSNDYWIDRDLQKREVYTGIAGINTQDFALQEGMGAICDRSKEFIGTSDKAVVALRRLLMEAIDVCEKGGALRGLDPNSYRDVRPFDNVVPPGTDWRTAFEKELTAKW